MKAFVTGSTGLLGSNLVRLLVAQGWQVKALARSAAKAQALLGDQANVEIVTGDMEDIGGFASHIQGCDVLFHTAAYFREYGQPGEHWAKLDAINITGTIRLLELAEQYGIGKVIYTSSSGVIGARADGQPSDESAPPSDFALRDNLYFKSKVVAEERIFAWLKTHSLPVVLILPGWMFGPSDAAPTAAGSIVQSFLARQLPTRIPGNLQIADARDVAQGMINAVERGRSGERYIIGGDEATLDHVMDMLEKVSGVPAPTVRVPYFAALMYGWVSETIARLQGKEALATVNGIRTLNSGIKITSAKAMGELGVRFRPLEDTLRDTVNWYRERANAAGAPGTPRPHAPAAARQG
jgi:dihydroflavonol-4-reductase